MPATQSRSFKKRGAAALLTAAQKGARKYIETTTNEAAAKVSPNKPLTEQQKEFVRQWAAGESISTAAARAGYGQDSYGYRIVHMPNARRMYEEEKRKYEEAAQMTRKKVMDMHLEAYQCAKLMSEPSAMVAAAREIGKMCGYYEPTKVQVDVNVQGQILVKQLTSMSDTELLKLLTEQTPAQLEAPKESNE
jgi:phage terminase small subunit